LIQVPAAAAADVDDFFDLRAYSTVMSATRHFLRSPGGKPSVFAGVVDVDALTSQSKCH